MRKQIDEIKYTIDVLLLEDGSCKFTQENEDCCKQNGFIYLSNKTNRGRVESRMKLAKNSKAPWIVFLDADMLPATEKFTLIYYSAASSKSHDVFIGGHRYENKLNMFNLRLRYGKAREEATCENRNKDPFKNIFFGNMMIKKEIFLSIFSTYTNPSYGEDHFLSAMLRAKKLRVLHLDNNTFHLGLEKNYQFLKKTEEATKTITQIHDNMRVNLEYSKLLRYYVFLKRLHLKKTVYFILRILIPVMRKTLVWFGGPLLFIDFYRLHYFLKHKKDGD